jgi:thioredoxin reductase (NADPH)
MAGKPCIVAVDDDPSVVRAIERDLRQKYGSEYRILRAESGAEALDALKELVLRETPVALLLSDQRMPEMNGVEFLRAAQEIVPDAKRVLLTAYADTEAAIRAINAARVNHYLVKPWDPPEEKLYPVLNDLLREWKAGYRATFEGLRVLGNRWSPSAHLLRDFLTRNGVPHKWLEIEKANSDSDVKRVADALGDEAQCLPVVFFADGTRLVQPTLAQVVEKIGLRTEASNPFYDLVIIGGGPTGLAAAVYGGSEGLRTLMIEREAPGGQAGMSSRIENYLGFPEGISGENLARRALDQARKFHVEVLAPQEVMHLEVGSQPGNTCRGVMLSNGSEIRCHALLVSTGVSYKKLNVPGIDRITGAGVYYGAAIVEAMSCADEDVYIIGGANSAGQAAMYYCRYARNVYMLCRSDSLAKGMSDYLINQLAEQDNFRAILNTSVTAVHGETQLEQITYRNSVTGEETTVPAAAMLIFIGAEPRTDWLDGVVQRDSRGFILTGTDLLQDGKRPEGWTLDRDPFLLETSVPGVFAAGDVRHGSIKRVASGVGEGAIAVSLIHQYLNGGN